MSHRYDVFFGLVSCVIIPPDIATILPRLPIFLSRCPCLDFTSSRRRRFLGVIINYFPSGFPHRLASSYCQIADLMGSVFTAACQVSAIAGPDVQKITACLLHF